jgi:membrane-associated phospholipid phosphatase
MTASHLDTQHFSYRAAKLITEVFAPVPSGLVVVAFVAWHFAPTRGGAVRDAVFGILIALLLPFGYLLRQVRIGHVTDHHVGLRTQRPRILLVFFLGVLVTLVVLLAVGSPPELIALIGASLVGLVVALIITFFWKISIHAGVAAGITTIFVILFGAWMLLMAPLVLAVGWARVRLGDHTAMQVAAGTFIGALVSGIAFTVFMIAIR